MASLERMLETLGVTEFEESIYGLLLERSKASVDHLSKAAGVSRQLIQEALDSLESRGLVSRSAEHPRSYMPAPPDVAIEALVLRRQQELEEVRLAAAQLAERFRRTGKKAGSGDIVEVLSGPEAVARQFDQIQRSAKKEVLVFDKPPYLDLEPNDIELENLRRGVRYRAIYDKSALETEGQWELLADVLNAGEEARASPQVPLKLAVVDRIIGLIPLELDQPGFEGALLLRASVLLDTLVLFFETLWLRAIPLSLKGLGQPGEEGPDLPSPSDRRILSMLASGLTDEAISRSIGVSRRTIDRRINDLLAKLDVETRFQAGLQAAKRGWL